MSPHQEVYGFAQGLQFNLAVAVVTILGWLVSKEQKIPTINSLSFIFMSFVFLMIISQIFAISPEYSFPYFDRFIKEMIFIFLCFCMLNNKARIHGMLWIYAIALGYYGVKGGAFTIVTGGGYHVVGPANSMISDNNQLGLALVMTLPVLFYLRLQTQRRFIRLGLLFSIGMITLCVLGTQSRGAFIGLAVMSGILIWRSRHRTLTLVALAVLAVPLIAFMPESWHERMATIENPMDDASFQGRVDAWWIAFKIALADPLTGGGFRIGYLQDVADHFTGGGYVARAHHSIYFEILAGMGFTGLIAYLLIMFQTWRNASRIRRITRGKPELRWAYDLSSMMQPALAGYAVAGASMSLEFWSGYWLLVPILMHTRGLVERALGAEGLKRQAVPGGPRSPAMTTGG